MKTNILLLSICLFSLNTYGQMIKVKPQKVVCSDAMPLQQIGGQRVVLDPLLVYQVCIDANASDNKNPQVAKRLVGAIKVTNNSKNIYQVKVYYFWKGNQINTELTLIKPSSTQLYNFSLTARAGKENENISVEVRSENTKKIIKPLIF